MNVTRRTRRSRSLLVAVLALVAALATVSATPAGAAAPTVLAGGSGHCC